MRTYKTLLLTATPVYNYPHDLANLIAMTKGESPLTDKEFDELVNGNKKVFDDYFDCVIYFYELDSKSGDYPEKTEEWINIPMTQQYYKDYMKVETLKSPDYKSPFIFLTGIRQATNSLEDAQKPRWAIRKIKEGQKTIVYSQFVDRGIETVKRLMPKNIKYAEITGKLTQKERNQIVKDFNSDAKGTPNVLLFTKAGAEGLDLKGVRNVIILESGWNRENEKQVLGRAVRYLSHSHLPMEERHVNIYHLVLRKPDKRIATDDGKESADEMLRKLIERKDKENQKFLKRLKNKKFDKCIGK